MAWPRRFSVMSYNLWNDYQWDRRRPAAEAFFALRQPDILGIQELRAVTRDFLDAALPAHRRVDDDLAGWTRESNLWWHGERFECLAHGAEPIEQYEEHRRLFWVRLRIIGPGEPTILVACVHFTWNGNPTEAAGGVSPRYRQAELAAAALDRLREGDEPVLIMGDFNDFCHPIRVLRRAGFTPAGELIGRPAEVTWPAFFDLREPPQAIDWMMVRGALRTVAWEVIDFHHDGTPPSDHKPIQGVFEVAGR